MELQLIEEEKSLTELTIAYQNLESENEDLRESLYYASSIQQGLMPQARHFEKLKNPYFIFYRPAKIIGGDFFWLGKKGDWTLYAVGDCTGHALSGAMLSSLAIGFLNYLVYSKNYTQIGEVLNELDKKWIETFKRDDDDQVNNDWLEISLIAYNSKTNTFQYSSAKRKIVLINSEGVTILKGNNYPIGGWQIEQNRNYSTHEFSIKQPFRVYLYSDGFQDQFGGVKNKRFGTGNLEKLLQGIQLKDIDAQEKEIQTTFDEWQGNQRQTDDVCLMGVEFN
jgi:serine phosphatase RsbU (regulator of sigma subunit)